jgi:hypothetical protein
MPVNRTYQPPKPLYVQTAAGTALTNSVAETALISYTMPADTLNTAEDVLSITAQGICTSTNANDTLTVKLYIGSTAIVSSAAVDVANNDIWHITAKVTLRTSGASGTYVVTGTVGLGASGTATPAIVYLGSTSIDTTASNVISVKGTWSAASASDSCRNDLFIVNKE